MEWAKKRMYLSYFEHCPRPCLPFQLPSSCWGTQPLKGKSHNLDKERAQPCPTPGWELSLKVCTRRGGMASNCGSRISSSCKRKYACPA